VQLLLKPLQQRGYIDYIGLGMYREWKKTEVPKSVMYEFGNNKIER
jgi:hypothetical protein